MLSNLSSDVTTNISSHLFGEPKYMQFKYNNVFKQIQQKTNLRLDRMTMIILWLVAPYVKVIVQIHLNYQRPEYALRLIIRNKPKWQKKYIKQSHMIT